MSLWIRIAFVAFVMVVVVSFFMKDRLPPAADIRPELQTEPQQRRVEHGPIRLHKDGVDYVIHPLYSYSLRGLVVSYHDSFSWVDYMHRAYGDTLNVRDLCVVWGENVKDRLYDRFEFKSGDFTCFYRTDDGQAWQAFRPDQLSNNHMLAGSEDIQKMIAHAEIGDQVAFQGFLARYEHSGAYTRGTSTTRTDTGDGACETVFVTDFKMLRKANLFWRKALDFSLFGAALTLALWLGLFVHEAAFPDYSTADSLHEQASLLAAKGRFRRARAVLDKSIEMDPTMVQAYRDRAVVLEQLGEFELAAADEETARQLELRERASSGL